MVLRVGLSFARQHNFNVRNFDSSIQKFAKNNHLSQHYNTHMLVLRVGSVGPSSQIYELCVINKLPITITLCTGFKYVFIIVQNFFVRRRINCSVSNCQNKKCESLSCVRLSVYNLLFFVELTLFSIVPLSVILNSIIDYVFISLRSRNDLFNNSLIREKNTNT